MFYGVWLYQQAFTYFHMGYASALAWVLFVVTMLCTALLAVDVEALGALRGRALIATVAERPQRTKPAHVRRKAFLMAVANHAVLIAVALAFASR